ncbi:hypothetical protein [Chitinimonas lacunae]|uniref:Uncharacterized protein n=1 Tax=Chitinimonas lacunae TaxID=1963018 RepID=A0ABV8MPB9_9NEIS
MKKFAARLLFPAVLAASALAHANSYDPATNRLTVDSVQVGDTIYTNVVISVGQIHSIGGSRPATPVAPTCSSANFTTAAFNAIKVGMTLDQVNQTMGCQYDAGATIRIQGAVVYRWQSLTPTVKMVQVWFNADGTLVTPPGGESTAAFKSSSGF